MPAGDTYRYNVVIGVEVATGGVSRGTRDIEQHLSRWEKKVAESVARIQKMLDAVGPATKKAMDAAEKAAQPRANSRRQSPEVDRINRETARRAQQTQKLIEMATKQRIDAELREERRKEREWKKIMDSEVRAVKAMGNEVVRTSQQAAKGSTDAFKGGFLGGLVGSMVVAMTSLIMSIPSKIGEMWDEVTKISAERANALLGLESIAKFKGVDEKAARESVQNLRLVKAGIVDVSEATTGMKNLLATGFSLDKATVLMERFSDSAAFGKQAALEYGRAIAGATEGIKNQNSALVDNAGVTKNISVILKERGFEMEDLYDKTKRQAALEALYTGLLKETAAQVGDADKLTKTYTGSVAALEQAQKNLNAAVGDIITQNPKVVEANKILTEQIDGYTKSVKNADSETARFVKNAVEKYALLKAASLGYIVYVIKAIESAGRAIGVAAAATAGAITAFWEIPLVGLINMIKNARAEVVDFINWTIQKARQYPILFPGLSSLEELPTPDRNQVQPELTNRLFELMRQNQTGFMNSMNQTADVLKELNQTLQRMKFAGTAGLSVYDPMSENPVLGGPLATRRPPPTKSGDEDTGLGGDGKKKAGRLKKEDFTPSPDAMALIDAAAKLGIRPLDLATIIAYETRGTFSPTVRGGEGNRYKGLIQFGPEEWKKFVEPLGAAGRTFQGQLPAVVEFLQSRFGQVGRTTSGASLMDLYRTVIGGNPNVPLSARDQNGSILQHLQRMTGTAKQQALTRLFGGSEANIRELTGGADFGDIMDEERRLRIKQLIDNAMQKFREATPVQTTEPRISTEVQRRLGPSEQYTKQLREQLGLTTSQANEMDRMTALAARSLQMEEEITTYVEERFIARREEALDLERDYQLMLRRNAEEERALIVARERNQLTAEILELEDRIATIGENSALRYQRAWTEATLQVKEAVIEANESIIRSNVVLDQQNTFHVEVMKARVLEHLAAQRDISTQTADSIIEVYEAAAKGISDFLDSIGIGKIPGIGSFLKAGSRSLLTNFTRSVLDQVAPGVADFFEKSENPMLHETKQHTKLLQQIVINTGKLAGPGTPVVNGIPGLPGITFPSLGTFGGQGGGWGNVFSSRTPGGTPTFSGQPITQPRGGVGTNFGIPNIFEGTAFGDLINQRQITSISSGAAAGIGSGAAAAGGSRVPGQGFWNQVKGIFGKGGIFGKQGFGWNAGTISGIGAIAGVAGGLIGGPIGGVLSGAASGIGAASALSTILGISSIGGPVGLAIGAAIGAIVGIGSWLFGRNKQRRADERTRNKAMLDSLQALEKIERDVNADRIDGEQAISQADDIRRQYVEAMSQLKDKKTRNIALRDVSRLDAVIARIKTAATNQQSRRDRLELFAPTFSHGGVVDTSIARNPLGSISGFGGPREDRVHAMLSNSEYVLDAVTTRNIGVNNLDWMRKHRGRNIGPAIKMIRRMGTPRALADGGFPDGLAPVGTVGSPMATQGMGGTKLHVTNNIYQSPEGTRVETEAWLETPEGRQKVVDVVEENIIRQGPSGQIPRAIREVNR